MLDVLGLFAVAERLLELLDEEGRSVGLDVDLGLAVRNRQLHRDADPLPLLRILDDVVTNLLRAHTCAISSLVPFHWIAGTWGLGLAS